MIWIILYIICTVICCGIILYTENIEFKDGDSVLAVIIAVVWPMYLIICTIFGIGHCIRLLLVKIFKTK